MGPEAAASFGPLLVHRETSYRSTSPLALIERPVLALWVEREREGSCVYSEATRAELWTLSAHCPQVGGTPLP